MFNSLFDSVNRFMTEFVVSLKQFIDHNNRPTEAPREQGRELRLLYELLGHMLRLFETFVREAAPLFLLSEVNLARLLEAVVMLLEEVQSPQFRQAAPHKELRLEPVAVLAPVVGLLANLYIAARPSYAPVARGNVSEWC